MSRSVAALAVLMLLGAAACTTRTELREGDLSDIGASVYQSPHSASDLKFAAELGVLHQQAGRVAAVATTKHVSPAVKELAARVLRTRMSWMVSLDALRGTWGVPDPAEPRRFVPGAVGERRMARLERLDGRRFEELWLDLMVANYRASLDLSRAEVARGSSEAGRRYARQLGKDLRADLEALEGAAH